MWIRNESGVSVEVNEKNKGRLYVMPASEGTDWVLMLKIRADKMPKKRDNRPKPMMTENQESFYEVATFGSVNEANDALKSARQTKQTDGAGWDASEYKQIISKDSD